MSKVNNKRICNCNEERGMNDMTKAQPKKNLKEVKKGEIQGNNENLGQVEK